MPYQTLLTHVTMDRGCAARLRMAVSVARALSVRTVGLGALAPWPYDGAAVGGDLNVERLVDSTWADISAVEKLFRDAFTQAGLAAEWRAEIAIPSEALVWHARVADLILAYRHIGAGTWAYVPPDTVLMETGAPVLFMPKRELEFTADTILFAWKNTREARRAIALSLPILVKAKRVLIAAVCRETELGDVESELSDVAERLKAHGANASTLAEVASPGAAGRRLLRIAQTDQSDLIVAGGFGHSRMREWILGGVTRDLIADGRRYVLLSH